MEKIDHIYIPNLSLPHFILNVVFFVVVVVILCVCVCVCVCVLSAGFPVWYTVRDNCRLYMILFLSWEHFHFIWIVLISISNSLLLKMYVMFCEEFSISGSH